MANIQIKQGQNFGTIPPAVLPSSPWEIFKVADITGDGFVGPIEVAANSLRVRLTLEGVWPEGATVEMHLVVDTSLGSKNPQLQPAYWPTGGRESVVEYPLSGALFIGATIQGYSGTTPLSFLLEIFE